MKTMTPERFDAVVRPSKPERLWGAPEIAQMLGVSENTVRNWARDPAVPIYAPRRGTYFAYRSELENWLRKKPAA